MITMYSDIVGQEVAKAIDDADEVAGDLQMVEDELVDWAITLEHEIDDADHKGIDDTKEPFDTLLPQAENSRIDCELAAATARDSIVAIADAMEELKGAIEFVEQVARDRLDDLARAQSVAGHAEDTAMALYPELHE